MKPISRLATLQDRKTGNGVGAKVNCRGHIQVYKVIHKTGEVNTGKT